MANTITANQKTAKIKSAKTKNGNVELDKTKNGKRCRWAKADRWQKTLNSAAPFFGLKIAAWE